MTTAFLDVPLSAAANGGMFGPIRPAARPSAGRSRFIIHDGDLHAIAITFAATAVVLVVAMLACDVYLGAIVTRGVRSIRDMPNYRLALDLLPWSLTFTALVTVVGLGGVAVFRRLRSDTARAGLWYRTV